jgi:preprotein translocase subunit YajC
MHTGKDMEQQSQELTGIQIGDKIRIRSGPYSGARGVIQSEVDGILEVLLDEGTSVNIEQQEITNYSLAARRAWQKMPKRAGRPQLTSPRKKMVSMRIDVEVWERLGEAVELGLIHSREEAVNTWLREQLNFLFNKEAHQNTRNLR